MSRLVSLGLSQQVPEPATVVGKVQILAQHRKKIKTLKMVPTAGISGAYISHSRGNALAQNWCEFLPCCVWT